MKRFNYTHKKVEDTRSIIEIFEKYLDKNPLFFKISNNKIDIFDIMLL
jgi:hypothetical protein